YSISHEPYPWKQMFANQADLHKYTNKVIDKYGLREKTEMNCNVAKIEWQEDIKQWHVHVDGGEVYEGQFVINASGPLSTPVIPDFKGRDTFKGKSFHSNDWDQNYDYKGKRVAVIGSGASAAQIIPAIAADVAHLDVFQRTPHWVLPRHEKVFKSWERALLKNKFIYKMLRWYIYWSLEMRVIGFKYSPFALNKLAQNPAKKHIEKQIKDPVLREKVTPDYTIGCKRIILSNTLYPAFCRDNVTLHSKDDGIGEITETGIITSNGEKIDLDLIVYSTGYDATDGVVSYPVIGRNGATLADFWSEFPRAYLGTTIPECPNLFMVTGPNTGIGHTSAIFVIEAQMNYIMNSINKVDKGGAQTVEVKAQAEDKYTTLIHSEMKKTVWHHGGCSSWYKSKNGNVIAMFPGFSFTYYRWADKFRADDHVIA
ncbi:MAG: NAD(P)/FAD-dependent oxidoreductase, partial [Oleibacter sp.]|nr:NAD(P)/FAD-dependent oxidoreductase [Thalassolituus sp.]